MQTTVIKVAAEKEGPDMKRIAWKTVLGFFSYATSFLLMASLKPSKDVLTNAFAFVFTLLVLYVVSTALEEHERTIKQKRLYEMLKRARNHGQ
ncbi:MAG: hypothetical protein WC158_03755 [Candidatus Paceibacterota bacterium]